MGSGSSPAPRLASPLLRLSTSRLGRSPGSAGGRLFGHADQQLRGVCRFTGRPSQELQGQHRGQQEPQRRQPRDVPLQEPELGTPRDHPARRTEAAPGPTRPHRPAPRARRSTPSGSESGGAGPWPSSAAAGATPLPANRGRNSPHVRRLVALVLQELLQHRPLGKRRPAGQHEEQRAAQANRCRCGRRRCGGRGPAPGEM